MSYMSFTYAKICPDSGKIGKAEFSKRSLTPQHVNNSTDAHEIAEKFCMHFAASSFDSYSEISSKLEGVQPP